MGNDKHIIEDFGDIMGDKDAFWKLENTISDYDLLRLATEMLFFARERLDSDLDNKEIYKEYTKLGIIYDLLKDIIENYV